ncbi:MAG: hypothetical protein KAI02_07865, partial [Gammaproteobacteria bacterium]|nr:hypothetical protein [Gammaproteobacteria bacterium]
MAVFSDINENLHFLISEVSLQITNLQLYLKKPSDIVARHILDRGGYFYNLKSRISATCHRIIASNKESDNINRKLKALDSIAENLAEIADLCGHCISNIEAGERTQYIYSQKYDDMLSEVNKHISKIEKCIYKDNTQQALKIGTINDKFRKINQQQQKKYIKRLKKNKSVKKLMTFINVINTLTQMGTVLLNISETIISSNLGKSVSTQRYNSLNYSIKKFWGLPMDKMTIETIAETRSGSGISGISTGKKSEFYDAIFKEGERKKLKEEKDKVESWHEIYPGLAPKIIDYQKQGSSASILIEHLPGYTYEKILLTESNKLLNDARFHLFKILKKIWKETYVANKV